MNDGDEWMYISVAVSTDSVDFIDIGPAVRKVVSSTPLSAILIRDLIIDK